MVGWITGGQVLQDNNASTGCDSHYHPNKLRTKGDSVIRNKKIRFKKIYLSNYKKQVFCLQLMISTTEPLELSMYGRLDICSRVVLGYFDSRFKSGYGFQLFCCYYPYPSIPIQSPQMLESKINKVAIGAGDGK